MSNCFAVLIAKQALLKNAVTICQFWYKSSHGSVRKMLDFLPANQGLSPLRHWWR